MVYLSRVPINVLFEVTVTLISNHCLDETMVKDRSAMEKKDSPIPVHWSLYWVICGSDSGST